MSGKDSNSNVLRHMKIIKTELTFVVDDHMGYGDSDLFDVSTGWDNLIEDLSDAGFILLDSSKETELEVKDLTSKQQKNYTKLEDQYLLDKFENMEEGTESDELYALLIERKVITR